MNQVQLLKRVLNSIPDKELGKYDLWVNNADCVKFIAIENDEISSNSISLITQDADVKINEMEW